MRTQTRNTKRKWDNYRKCTLYTATSVFTLNFDLEFKDYEMIASVMETYKLDKSEIIGVEIARCKFRITLPNIE